MLDLFSKSILEEYSWRTNSVWGSKHAAAVFITVFLDKLFVLHYNKENIETVFKLCHNVLRVAFVSTF